MIDQFNRINNAFGANRVRLEEVGDSFIRFKIDCLAEFYLYADGELEEWIEGDYGAGCYGKTDRSRWLHAISLGKKRDEEGRVG